MQEEGGKWYNKAIAMVLDIPALVIGLPEHFVVSPILNIPGEASLSGQAAARAYLTPSKIAAVEYMSESLTHGATAFSTSIGAVAPLIPKPSLVPVLQTEVAEIASTTEAIAVSGTPNSTIPKIALGEIKPGTASAYNKGLRQLSSRKEVSGNTALVTYDSSGNVTVQAFAKDADGVRRIIWEGHVGRVEKLPPGKYGTGPYGNAIEPEVRSVLEKATGQKFKVKSSSATGPDLVPEP